MELGPHEIRPPIAEKLLEAGGYLGIERVFFFSRNVAVLMVGCFVLLWRGPHADE